MQSPVKKEFITQRFGENPQNYQKYGLVAHNGLDFRAFLPNGDRAYSGGVSEVFAPHGGKIIENAFDAGGYGNYIKIEDGTQGSVLAHFSARSPLQVGATVTQGQIVGYQGTTGNSTGLHLHWGWYPIPRDRNNGYNGFVNQEGKYTDYQGGDMANMYKGYDLANPESMKVAVDVLVRLQSGELIEKTEHDRLMKEQLDTLIKEKDQAITEAYDKGMQKFYQCETDYDKLAVENAQLKKQLAEQPAQPPIDLSDWELNGLQVVTTVSTGSVVRNYKLKA